MQVSETLLHCRPSWPLPIQREAFQQMDFYRREFFTRTPDASRFECLTQPPGNFQRPGGKWRLCHMGHHLWQCLVGRLTMEADQGQEQLIDVVHAFPPAHRFLCEYVADRLGVQGVLVWAQGRP